MDDAFKSFLEKFAELERRVRKLAAEDRALRQEVKALRIRLEAAESQADELKDQLAGERTTRSAARERLSELIESLKRLRGGEPDFEPVRAEGISGDG